MKNLIELENLIDYHFVNPDLLVNALTHSSYANENKKKGISHNERMEFLGDSILGQITAEFLFKIEPAIAEGKMTKLRSELVCETALHRTAVELGLGQYILLGKGEEKNGGRERTSILADAVEAIIAAMYIDGGYKVSKKFIFEHILNVDLTDALSGGDWKTKFQEFVQRDPTKKISYKMISESGPDHNKIFKFAVLIDDLECGTGTGHTKKEAEQEAARVALEALKK